MDTQDTHTTIEAVWRAESPRLLGGLYRVVRDLDVAEELAQEALLAALEQWPREGIPRNPGAWLMATAKHRGIDRLRARARHARKHSEIKGIQALEGPSGPSPDPGALGEPVDDDALRLIFIACHPLLTPPSQVALTLRLIGGLTTAEIARAFLSQESTVAQRISRAKRTLAEASPPFEIPPAEALAERLGSVLEVVYLIFNEGYAASGGEDWIRADLCREAERLGRLLADLMPEIPEVHGLVSLMALQASRIPARLGPKGEAILLLAQDRSLWDRDALRRGLEAFTRAVTAGPLGPYGIQAAIAACHARAPRPEDTDWDTIAALYGALGTVSPSPVVELNRGVAVAMAEGPEAGLAIVDALTAEPALKGYHLLPSVRGDLLMRLGRWLEAREALERALSLAQSEPDRAILRDKLAACAAPRSP